MVQMGSFGSKRPSKHSIKFTLFLVYNKGNNDFIGSLKN